MTASTALPYSDLPHLLGLQTGDEKHDRSVHSTLDVLWVLYDRVLEVDPSRLDDPERETAQGVFKLLMGKKEAEGRRAWMEEKGHLIEADL